MSADASSRALIDLLAERLIPVVTEAVRGEVRAALAEQVCPPPERLLTTAEAAERVSVHPETIRRAVRRGDLPATRALGHVRVRPGDLEVWLSGRRSEDG